VVPKPKKTPVDLGYEYKIKPLLETAPSDPLLALMKSAESHDKDKAALPDKSDKSHK
jgi:hypothetical protein